MVDSHKTHSTHLIPQILLGTILMFPHAILHEASVTFLGFGLSPSRTGNWYHFIRVYEIPFRRILVACIFPGLSLLIVVLAFDMIGDNLGKIIDPKTAHE